MTRESCFYLATRNKECKENTTYFGDTAARRDFVYFGHILATKLRSHRYLQDATTHLVHREMLLQQVREAARTHHVISQESCSNVVFLMLMVHILAHLIIKGLG